MATAELRVKVNLDPVPGAFHTPDSARDGVQQMLDDRIRHYEPEVSLVSENIYLGEYGPFASEREAAAFEHDKFHNVDGCGCAFDPDKPLEVGDRAYLPAQLGDSNGYSKRSIVRFRLEVEIVEMGEKLPGGNQRVLVRLPDGQDLSTTKTRLTKEPK